MRLVDVYAVRDVLNSNIGEDVSHYVIFTNHGTLMAHDDGVNRESLTKFASFAGTVWRNHSDQVAATGSTNPGIGGLPAVETLDAQLSSDGKSLQQLTVEIDEFVTVIRLIVPRLLVAAQLESSEIYRRQRRTSTGTASTGSFGRGGTHSANSRSNGVGNAALKEPANSEGYRGDGEGAGDARKRSQESVTSKPSKMRILELKAEGMADFLAAEYPTNLPKDFY